MFPHPLQIHPGTGREIGCSEVFSHLRFPTIPDSIAERSNHAQSRHRTKGTFTCCAQRLPAPPELARTHQHPSHLQVPAAASAAPQRPRGTPGAREPPSSRRLLPTQSQEPDPGGPGVPLPSHLAIASVTTRGLGHPWVPVPPELRARGDGRNVLAGSTALPANKRSKLEGAEPAGGIWQLTCHFVRHWSKLISLAERP